MGNVAPLWVPFVLIIAIPAWIFVWYLILTFLADIAAATYPDGLRTPAPAWKQASSVALFVPAFFIAFFGFFGLGVLLVASIGSIIGN